MDTKFVKRYAKEMSRKLTAITSPKALPFNMAILQAGRLLSTDNFSISFYIHVKVNFLTV